MIQNNRLIKEVLPDLSKELKNLLRKDGKIQLAESVDLLFFFEKCSCDEKSCASFYTAPKPNGSFGAGHENLMLDAESGFLILDVVNEEIKFIEILDRPEYKKLIDQI